MALIQITADLSKVAKALERIAKALERAIPEIEDNSDPSTEKDIHTINYEIVPPGEDDLWTNYAPRRNY